MAKAEADVALIQTESYTFLQDKENTACAEPLATAEVDVALIQEKVILYIRIVKRHTKTAVY
ncbi:hypothetical protein [Sporomusa malonica]|uniref:hypothetical protein n=1 Tax=Sporomusa malonica TaxID=112901 RepID=UPI000A015BFE|nr:hypothetical protein [Sporomusa malonica]